MKYDKDSCLNSLKKAADILGKSPTVKEYENLDISPSYATIMKRFGTWNNAKDSANLKQNINPEDVYNQPVPENLDFTRKEWENLTIFRRNVMRKKSRAAKIKMDSGCEFCGYDDHPAGLDFHHTEDNKESSVSELVSCARSQESIDKEIEKCIVLCAVCHRVEDGKDHYDY